MKKLSFIMAVLMILMCMPVMAMTSVSAAEEEALVDLAIPSEWSATEGEGDDAVTVWPTVAQADAIGYVVDNGTEVCVDTWAHVGDIVRANTTKEVVLYLIKNIELGGRLGSDSGATNIDITGGNLTIDGSVGQSNAQSGGVNYEIKRAGRVIHFGDNCSTGGTLTLRNVKINNTGSGDAGKGTLQINVGGPLLVIEEGTEINNPVENGVVVFDKVIVNGGKFTGAKSLINLAGSTGNAEMVINGGTFDSTGHGIMISASDAKVTINDAKVTVGVAAAIYSGNKNQTITVNGGSYTGAIGMQANASSKGGVFNIYGGTFTGNHDDNYCLTEVGANTWNVYGGTFTNVGTKSGTLKAEGSLNVFGSVMNIYGGVFTTNGTGATNVTANKTGAKTINIYGGSFVNNKGGTAVTIVGGDFGKNADGTKKQHTDKAANSTYGTINIYGGSFVVKNFADGPINEFSNTTPIYKGTLYASNGSAFNIYGGNYALYKDNGITPATEAAIVYGWSTGAKIMHIYGGTFTGGKYAYALVKYSGKAATSADKTLPYDAENSVAVAYPEGETTVSLNAPVVQEGASVRLDAANSGLRFTSRISSLTIDFIKANLAKEGTELSYGTMIVPSSYVKYAGGELTMEAFDKAGKAYLNIEAKDGVVVNEDGSVTINAAMINIKKENYDRDFIAVSYIKYTNTVGEEVISYANNVNLAQYSRNVEEIAYSALSDVLTTSAGTYTNKVSEYYVWNQNARKYEVVTGTAYSRYNADQLAVLKSYIVAE